MIKRKKLVFFLLVISIAAVGFALRVVLPQGPVYFTSLPAVATVGEPVTVQWFVASETEKEIIHSAIHFDYTSHPGYYGTDVLVGAADYPDLFGEYATKNSTIPRFYNVTMVFNRTGPVYMRAHAVIDDLNWWSEERSIAVR